MTRTATAAGVMTLAAALLIGHATAADKDEAKDDLKTLRDDIEKIKSKAELDSRLTNTELKVINERLDRLEQAIEKLNGKTKTRTSSSFTPAGAGTGTLRLDNRMAVEAEVTLDGVTYRVAPLSTRVLRDRPAGTFEYTVGGSGMGTARRRTVLSGNETLTVTITPPAVRLFDQ